MGSSSKGSEDVGMDTEWLYHPVPETLAQEKSVQDGNSPGTDEELTRNELIFLKVRQVMAMTADVSRKEWKGRLKPQGNTG